MTTPESKAREIVAEIECGGLTHTTYEFYVNLITQAIRESAPKEITGKEIKEAAYEARSSDHCRASFIVGAKWAQKKLKGE